MNSLLPRTLSAIVVVVGLALAACSPSTPGSPRGDTAAVQQSGGNSAGNRSVNPTRDRATTIRTLDANEIGLVYALLFQEYVDPVDGAKVVNAAEQSVSELMHTSGFLPMDLSIVDLAPVSSNDDPASTWSGFSSAYEALVEKHAAWARQARPDQAAVRGMLASLTIPTRHLSVLRTVGGWPKRPMSVSASA